MEALKKRMPYVWILGFVALSFFVLGLFVSLSSQAANKRVIKKAPAAPAKVIFKEQTKLDFEGLQIEGQVDDPGEFYFQHRPSEKFDSLVQRRKNFHREMLRDVVLSK